MCTPDGFSKETIQFKVNGCPDSSSTFQKPHQLATGMLQVFVNGEQVLRDGAHTGATPGRFVKGPGWVEK